MERDNVKSKYDSLPAKKEEYSIHVNHGIEADADAVVKEIKKKTGVNLLFGSRVEKTVPGFNFGLKSLSFFNLTK